MGFRIPVPGFIRAPKFISSIDFDKVLSLRASKYVEIRDRRIGILYYLCNIVVIAYIIVYVFIVQQKYYETEESIGIVTSKVKGTAWAPDPNRVEGFRSFDALDLIYPGIEADGLFIGTRYQATNNQKFGMCPRTDPKQDTCHVDADCRNIPPLDLPKCVNGWCMSNQWCPAENQTFPNEDTLLWDIMGSENFTIWIKSFISFPELDSSRVFSSMVGSVPSVNGTGRDLFTLQEFLSMAEPPMKYEDIQKDGVIITVKMRYHCYLYLNGKCLPKYSVTRMDGDSGFNLRKSSYFMGSTEVESLRRNDVKMWGVRIYFVASGKGFKFSIQQIILQIASAFALFSLSMLISEYALMYFLPESVVYKDMVVEKPIEFKELPTHNLDGNSLNWEEKLSCLDKDYHTQLMHRKTVGDAEYDSLDSESHVIQDI